jgi:carboxyl-terminal processing protease
VILDLRNNAGGLLDAAVETCDLFLDGGRIVSTRGRDRRERSVFDARPAVSLPPHVPLAILINKYSASASEIVAACLQDHQRAVVIGERTWGKGTVQNLLKIEGGRSALKLTTASYWRPSGKNIHRGQDVGEEADWGVRPDPGFEVRLNDEEMEQVRLARRQRDLGRDASSGGQPSSESPAVENASVDSATEGMTGDDRQLRKAVEYLQERLKSAAGR